MGSRSQTGSTAMADIALQHAVQAFPDELVTDGDEVGLRAAVVKDGALVADAQSGVAKAYPPPANPEQRPVMTTPHTELDTRFSEPAARPTSWEDTLEAIKQAEIFWISTVRTDGRPHVTPLVAVWLDDALHFSTGPEEQKARNLAGNPRVALTTGANEWQSGLDVVVEGEAARVTDAQQLDRLAAAWAQKWDGRWLYEVGQDGFRHGVGTVLVFAVRPAKVLAFTKGGFSHTRHCF